MTWGIFKEDSVSEAYKKMKAEELKGKQYKLDVDKDGKIEGEDLAKLRKEETELDESVAKVAQAHGFQKGSGINKGSYVHPKTGHTITALSNNQFGHSAKDGKTISSFKPAKDLESHLAKHGYTKESVDESVNKSDIPAYKRKDDKLTLADLEKERTKNKSHSVQLAKNNGTQKEAVEELDEISKATLKSYVKGAKDDVAAHKDQKSSAMDQGDHKTASDSAAAIAKRQAGMKAAKAKLNKEEAEVSAEELVEYEAKDGVYKHQAKAGRYGGSEKESDYVKGPSNAELKKIEAEKKKKVKEDLDIFSEKEIDILISEVLKASDDAGKWISDFTKSDDPRFSGDSKEQRKKRALAAYYAAQKNESVDYDSFLEEEAQGDIVKMSAKKIKHGNIEDKDDEKDVMEPNSEGEADFLDKHSVSVTDEPAAAAGNDQSGKDKVATATGPKGQGAGKYDGKGKTGVKESKGCSSEDDSETNEEASCSTGKKKSYTSFKEKMKAKA